MDRPSKSPIIGHLQLHLLNHWDFNCISLNISSSLVINVLWSLWSFSEAQPEDAAEIVELVNTTYAAAYRWYKGKRIAPGILLY